MQFGSAPGPGNFFPSGPGATGRPQGRKTSTKPVPALTYNAPETPAFLQLARDLIKEHGTSSLPTNLQPRWLLNKKNAHISQGMTKGQ